MSGFLVLVGGGGHGRVVLDTALSMGLEILGIVDAGFARGDRIFGVPVLDGDDVLHRNGADSMGWLNGIGANPDIARRRAVFDDWGGDTAVGVVHPGAAIGRECRIASSAQIMAGVTVQSRTSIGDNAVINTGAQIDHDCCIGAHSFIAPGAILCGDVALEEGVFVGAGATLLPGVRIGRGTIIAAASVVTSAVPPAVLMRGSPARPIRSIEQ
ncbi:MAG: NeuD/PglB/VioB family sugar acetyltransferase [Sphingomonas sp.]